MDKHHTTAGVGIAVSNNFLKRFNEWIWEDILPGYVATLLLKGDEGILQIMCIYAPSSSSADREATWHRLHPYILPTGEALCIFAGDFNSVEEKEDRYNLTTGLPSGGMARGEAHEFNLLKESKGLYQLELGFHVQAQPLHRHAGQGVHQPPRC